MTKAKRVVSWGLALVASAAAIAATTRGLDAGGNKSEAGRPPANVKVDNAPLGRDPKLHTSYSPVVKQAAPTVVNIFTTKNIKQRPEMMPFFGDPFRRFFGDRFGPGDGEEGVRPRQFKQQSLGSGVIVTEDGYIITNNHVVDGADEIKVAMPQGNKEYTARLIGGDSKTDIAVLKIDAKGLPFATLADSDKLEVGDVVLAIGNPFAVGQTVTMGIVSATGRGGMGIEDYEDFIQTDAAINPGNSGGALVDAEGRLVGINTAILSRTGGNQGIGFAVPVNLARDIMEHLIRDGKVTRGLLGVMIQDLNPELSRQFKAPEAGGALIADVQPNSAAAVAGLKDGDVVTAYNGKPVRDSRNLKLMVARTAPGQKVDVKVLRDGKERTVAVTLKELKDDRAGEQSSSQPQAAEDEILAGVGVGDLTPQTRREFGVPEHVHGAVVQEVPAGSPAYEAGLRPGDVIQEINRKPIRNAEDAVAATTNVKEKKALVKVWSRGGSRFVIVDETERK